MELGDDALLHTGLATLVTTYSEDFHVSWQNISWCKANTLQKWVPFLSKMAFHIALILYIYIIFHSHKTRHKSQISIYLQEERKLTKKLLWESTSRSTLSLLTSKSGKNQMKSEWQRKRWYCGTTQYHPVTYTRNTLLFSFIM